MSRWLVKFFLPLTSRAHSHCHWVDMFNFPFTASCRVCYTFFSLSSALLSAYHSKRCCRFAKTSTQNIFQLLFQFSVFPAAVLFRQRSGNIRNIPELQGGVGRSSSTRYDMNLSGKILQVIVIFCPAVLCNFWSFSSIIHFLVWCKFLSKIPYVHRASLYENWARTV